MDIAPEIVIDSRVNNYSKNAVLLGSLIEGLTGNINFLNPNPDLPALTAAYTSLFAAIAAHGPKGNRGGKAALLDLRKKSTDAYRLIKTSVAYITNVSSQTAGGNAELTASIMSTAGLSVRTSRTPQGLLGAVRDIRQVNAPGLKRNQVKWLWRKPLGVTSSKNVKFNKVFRSTSADFSTAQLIATPTRSSFVDTNNTGEVITYIYWFAAVTAHGDGSISDPIAITLLPA